MLAHTITRPLQDLRERITSILVTERRDFSIAFVMERTYERVQLVMVQLSTIRFARRSCGRSKILCKQLILRLSVNGLKEEASPTENG